MPSTTTTPKVVIFTDLDGTLLDRVTYSFEPSQPALDLIKQKGVPLVLVSSKTRAEIEFFRKRIEIDHPFISENGGAVFIPKGYFSFPFHYNGESDEYLILELGTPHPQLLKVLNSVKKETAIPIKGFSDLTAEELASFCGLSAKEAEYAKKREYDEPFLIEGGEQEREAVRKKITGKGWHYVWGGKFHHILGNNDKGKAVEILKELYENEFFSVSTMAVGDSPNDFPMLAAVDHPFLLKEKEPTPLETPYEIRNITIVEGTGPSVWNEVIQHFLSRGPV
jgi:mannosyl-3-phosphoglycerate phosphatase